MSPLTLIAFDADDTLWQNESLFRLTQAHLETLLTDFADPAHLHDRLLAAERRNLGHYGFGVKGFMLSMIETAIEVTAGRVNARVIAEILSAGRQMLQEPVALLPHAEATLRELAQTHQILVITKGDLLDQERKVAQSGLAELFCGVEIVSDKTAGIYAKIFTRYGHHAQSCMMVGNSMKSDVLPALAAGAFAVHIPHGQTWELERADGPENSARFFAATGLCDLPALVQSIEASL